MITFKICFKTIILCTTCQNLLPVLYCKSKVKVNNLSQQREIIFELNFVKVRNKGLVVVLSKKNV